MNTTTSSYRAPRQDRAPSQHDGLAVTAFVLAFLLPLIGFILGWVSIASAHSQGRRASGLAVAGLIIGLLVTVIVVVVVVAAAVAASNANDPVQQYINCINAQLNNPNVVCTPPAGA